MERQKFDDSWRESFKDAEVSPSESLWTNIELDLEKENSSKMKRRILFFQLLAAASVAFAMSFAGLGVYLMLESRSAETLVATGEASSNNPASQNANRENQEISPSTTGQPSSSSMAENSQAAATQHYVTTPGAHPGNTAGNPASTPQAGQTTTQPAPAQQHDLAAAEKQSASPANREAGHKAGTPAGDASTGAARPLTARVDETGAPGSTRTSRVQQPSNRDVPASSPHAASQRPIAANVDKGQLPPAASQGAYAANSKKTQSPRAVSQGAIAVNADKAQQPDAAAQDAFKVNNGKTQTANAASPGAVAMNADKAQLHNAGAERQQANGAVASTAGTGVDLSKTQGKLPVLVNPAAPVLVMAAPSSEPDPVALMLARLSDQEKQFEQKEKESKKKDKGTERLWTSVGFAAGSYSMVTSSAANNAAAASASFDNMLASTSNNALTDDVIHKQASAPGVAYSVGLNLGTRLATRWVLQGGVNYLTQSSNYTTNAAVVGPEGNSTVASINELDKISTSGRKDTRVVNTAEYNVNSSLQYFSVPLQAGYLLVNRTFGLQFNAGVSTDLFIRNTLTPDGGSFQKTTQTRADDSPYRPINFSGLVGTEFSYRFGRHYRVALNPGFRYPFSSIYKSDIAVSAAPLTFDVGLKFRYIFH